MGPNIVWENTENRKHPEFIQAIMATNLVLLFSSWCLFTSWSELVFLQCKQVGQSEISVVCLFHLVLHCTSSCLLATAATLNPLWQTV